MRWLSPVLAATLLGCPPVPGKVDQTYDQGVAAGYVTALQQIDDMTTSLDAMQAELDDVSSRLQIAEAELAVARLDIDDLLAEALVTGDVAIFPNTTQADPKAYQVIPEGAWVPVDLPDSACRFVYLKLRFDVSAISPTAYRDVWYAVGETAPALGVSAPYGGVGSLMHVEVDADKTPDIYSNEYVWVDLEGSSTIYLLITPDVSAGASTADLRVAQLGCLR